MAGFPALSDPDIWRLVAYLRSLSPSASSADAGAGGTGDAAAGETLFFGTAGCSGCHEVNGRGGIVGPDLSGAARFAPASLRQKLLEPNAPLVAAASGRGGRSGPATVVVKTKDGRSIHGVRRNEDTFSLQMIDTSGDLHLLDKRTLDSVSVENFSLHPPDTMRLSGAQISNLVAYLSDTRWT